MERMGGSVAQHDLSCFVINLENFVMTVPLRTVYANLKRIDEVDVETSALYRQRAQEVLAQSDINLARRQVIARRLMQANQFLGMNATNQGDSY
jgi:hypothetical protein